MYTPRTVYVPPAPYAPVYAPAPVYEQVYEQAYAPVIPPPSEQYWYFCAAANAYYPYVRSCPTGWQAVPATPPR
jgi:hypothetical protein